MKKILLICIISVIDIFILFFIIFIGLNYVGKAIFTNIYYLPINSKNVKNIEEIYEVDELYSSKFKNKNIYYFGIVFKQSFPNGYDVELLISDNSVMPNIIKSGFIENRPLEAKKINDTILGIFFGLIIIEILSIYYIIQKLT